MQKNNIVIYTSKDGTVKVDTALVNETIRMNQSELAKLFNTTKNNISLHMKNIFESGELEESSTIKNFLTVQKEGTRTAVDYDPKSEISINFFKTVQNKMHFATHGQTAAEVIFNRVDVNKDNIGLTNFKGNSPTRKDKEIAKNYLTEEELNILNRMLSAYLDVAEINELDHYVMTTQD